MMQSGLFGRLVLAILWAAVGLSAACSAPAAPGTSAARVTEAAGGLRGIRMVADDSPTGQKLQQVFCLFSGRGTTRFVVTASTLASERVKYGSAIDRAMKTFTIK